MIPPIKASMAEKTLSQYWQSELQPLWQRFVHADLISSDQTRLSYSYYLADNRSQAVVFSTGRVEMAVKYIELMHEFIAAGYSVFILDHRGQGRSARLQPDPHLGYVADFQDYVSDFNQFVTDIVQPTGHRHHVLLAHSMGAAIACCYLQQYPHPFLATIFGSPMFGLHAGHIPSPLATRLVAVIGWLRAKLKRQDERYFPGQTSYLAKPFAENLLTHSNTRYQWLLQLYQQDPDSQLGGVSWTWLTQAIRAMASIQAKAQEFMLPVLLLQAAEDQIVSNQAQNNWFDRLPAPLYKQKIILTGAHHEIWMEQDTIRQQAVAAVNQFLGGLL
ncbi:MAG: alpha/beta hydrolase [Rheinheimera sp.]|nr:alpha/beta hydrolase [Rheinheimera sp.]MBM34245.1 alpha/beta hydrolase [Rheinheimera sp.]HAW92243.1 alpha/beta hydrolase [Candidatus Azambacteria bacterium]|tara:strand:+ start:319 stop:1311 length:993 start_codon:yes stop_codon:yes gene_type:complete